MNKFGLFSKYLYQRFHQWVEGIGESIKESIDGLGRIMYFTSSFFYWVFKRPFRVHLFIEQLYFIGNKSILIILLSGGFTGMVLATQTYFGFKLINVDSLVGAVTGFSMLVWVAVFGGLLAGEIFGSTFSCCVTSTGSFCKFNKKINPAIPSSKTTNKSNLSVNTALYFFSESDKLKLDMVV